MISSTPQQGNPQNNLRKSVLMRNVNGQPQSVRKLLSNISNQSPVSADAAVNDDLERSNRRSEADIQRRVSNISSPSSSPKNFNTREVQDHLHTCIKMFTENKITSKNAWNLKIIDYMRSVLQSQGMAKDSLQIASTSLDVGAKVYGIRVDDVYFHGMKLASDMARVEAKKQTEAGDENDRDSEEETQENEGRKKSKKKRSRSGPKVTVAKDPKTLLSDVPKLESVFFQNRTDLGSSAVENLISNRIPLNHGCYKYMLLNKENAWPSYKKLDPVLQTQKTYEQTLTKVKLNICPAFSQIHIDEWSPEQQTALLNEERQSIADELVYDAQGLPIPELDGSMHNVFADGGNDCGVSSEEEETVNGIGEMALHPVSIAHIVDFNPKDNNVYPDDYSYSNAINLMGNRRITQVWAGPSHWKLKYIRRNLSRFSGQQEPQAPKVKKARFQPNLISFTEDIPGIDKKKLVKNKRFKIDEDPCKITLPQFLINENHWPRSLLSKPIYININNNGEQENHTAAVDGEVQPYNYENPNDSQYCSQNNMGLGDNDDDDDDDNGAGAGDNEEPFSEPQNFEDNLVEAPEMVPKTCVPYAMHAKKMDMKKLKGAVWKTLIKDYSNEQISEKDMYKKKANSMMFSSLFTQLPTRLPHKLNEELSCPLAFVALLHLCNEQNLQLTGQSDLKDFKIEQT